MKQLRALVSGATGFVGSHLVKYLLGEGWAVDVIVRPGSKLEILASILDDIVVHRHNGDIESMRSVMGASSPDVVFHVASLFLSDHTPQDVPRLIDSNLSFGTQLVEAMSLEGVRHLVNTGTSWQHYENDDYSPVNLYAATKQAFEALLQYYVEVRDLRVITLKLFDTYGQNDPRPKLMNLLRRVASDGGPLAMSPGEQLIDLVHVDDVARAFVVAADRMLTGESEGHERFAVSSRDPIALRNLVQQVERVIGQLLPIEWGARPYRPREIFQPWRGPILPKWHAEKDLELGLRESFAS